MAEATVVLYPGSFDPFHQTHKEEVLAVLRQEVGADVKILPVETASYNELYGVQRPQVFPYDRKLQLIAEEFKDFKNVRVSDELRSIPANPLRSLNQIIRGIKDPDIIVLVGSDVPSKWRDLRGFKTLLDQARLYVTTDRGHVSTDAALERVIEDYSRIERLEGVFKGHRSRDINLRIFEGSSILPNSLGPAFASYVTTQTEELKKDLQNFRIELLEYGEAIFLEEILPLLAKKLRLKEEWVEIVEERRALQDDFLRLRVEEKSGLHLWIERLEALSDESIRPQAKEKLYERLLSFLSSEEYRTLENASNLEFINRSLNSLERIPFARAANVPKSSVRPPRYLYHWTTHSKLQRMVDWNQNSAELPLRYIKGYANIAWEYPILAGRPGLFAWSHPITGMYFDLKTETYAREEKGRPPRLLAMEIDPQARVLELVTPAKVTLDHSVYDYDLIFHKALDERGRVEMAEWILINPEVVRQFSANPKEVRPLLEPGLEVLKDSSREYSIDELMVKEQKDKEAWKRLLAEYLKGRVSGIPRSMMGRLSTKAYRCELAIQSSIK